MPQPPDEGLPLDIRAHDPSGKATSPRGWFRKRYLLVLLVPVIMFSGAVIGMYFQPPLLRAFYGLTGLQPGAGSDTPIALPPNVELPKSMADTMLPTDVIGLARIMPKGDVSVVAAPYGAGDARIAEILVSVGQAVDKGAELARLDNATALQGAVLTAEANLAIREAALLQTRVAVQASRDEAQASLDQAVATASEAAANFRRTEELFQRGVATEATLDAARAAADGARLAVTRRKAGPATRSGRRTDCRGDPGHQRHPGPTPPCRRHHADGRYRSDDGRGRDQGHAGAAGGTGLARSGPAAAGAGRCHRADRGPAGPDLGRCSREQGRAGDPGSGCAGSGVLGHCCAVHQS